MVERHRRLDVPTDRLRDLSSSNNRGKLGSLLASSRRVDGLRGLPFSNSIIERLSNLLSHSRKRVESLDGLPSSSMRLKRSGEFLSSTGKIERLADPVFSMLDGFLPNLKA